jgi:hypothetical protein
MMSAFSGGLHRSPSDSRPHFCVEAKQDGQQVWFQTPQGLSKRAHIVIEEIKGPAELAEMATAGQIPRAIAPAFKNED